MTIAKGIGGGFPMGACLATADAAKGLTAGVHGSTFGGNPLAMAVGNAVLDIVLAPGFVERVARLGLLARQRLAALEGPPPRRHRGGARRRAADRPQARRFRPPISPRRRASAQLLTIPAGDNVVRLLPPLTVREEELAEGVRRLDADLRRHRSLAAGRRRRRGGMTQTAKLRHARAHFLDLLDYSSEELRAILDAAKAMKAKRIRGERPANGPLAGKTLALVFERPSTRTRVSFDLAMRELGGDTIMLTGTEMQLGRGESLADTARVLSRYVDAIMVRILDHGDLEELARYATVPVINGLTKRSHPCQVMADLMTFEEHCGPIRGQKIAWSGDYNNVLSSWIDAAQRFDFQLDIACPKELQPPPERIKRRAPPAPTSSCARTRPPRSPAPPPSSRTAGCRWATRTRAAATICSRPIRSTAS